MFSESRGYGLSIQGIAHAIRVEVFCTIGMTDERSRSVKEVDWVRRLYLARSVNSKSGCGGITKDFASEIHTASGGGINLLCFKS